MIRQTVLAVLLVVSTAVLYFGGAQTYELFTNQHNGFTAWNCREPRPNAFVRHRLVLDSIEQAISTAYHEDMHVQQMQRYDSCLAYKMAWYRNPDSVGFEMEAEAFMEQAWVSEELGMYPSLDSAINRYAKQLSQSYPYDKTPEEARAKMLEYLLP